MILKFQRGAFDLTKRTAVMGILNVTPDSFSDGSRYLDKGLAVEHACRMAEEGADIVDIGGESTRPGSDAVPLDEELKRVIPVIEAIAAKTGVPVSIDTYKAEVARRAIDAGASVVNDISGLRFDPGMAKIVAERKVPLILMHIRGTPRNMQANPHYLNVVSEVSGL